MISKLAVALPSRGLMHSRTAEELISNLEGIKPLWELFMTHDRPIPDCFNILTKAALRWGAEAIWFVEEDMNLPPRILKELLAVEDADIVAADYPIAGDHSSYQQDVNGKVMFCGCGCMLVHRRVFEALGEPYWRSNVGYSVPDWREIIYPEDKVTYGKQDVDFGIRANLAGFKIKLLDKSIGHYKVKKINTSGNNHGFHEVEKWDKINRRPPIQEFPL
jgi:GT2 family glycosyltransferase